MNQEMKNDLIVVLSELKQIRVILKTHRQEQMDIIKELTDNSIHWLHKYVDDDDVLGDL